MEPSAGLNSHPPSRPVFFRRKDLLVVAGILLLALLLYLFFTLGRQAGGTAQITIIQGDGQTVQDVSLAEDQILHIDGAGLPVTLQVQGGRIRFIDSVCPDHVCENTGWLQYEGDEAICLPAGVWVKVTREAPTNTASLSKPYLSTDHYDFSTLRDGQQPR